MNFSEFLRTPFCRTRILNTYFKFIRILSQILGHVENAARLERSGYFQNTAIHTLLNISKTKGNQTMKFGQLKEYDMRNIFVKKS